MNSDLNNDSGQMPLDHDETPAIFSLGQIDGQTAFSRRTFLEIAAVAAGAAALPSGCSTLGTLQGQSSPALAHKEPITALAVDDAGKLLASGDKSGTIKLWQLPEGVLLQSWSGRRSPIVSLAFPHQDNTLWSLDIDAVLKRWRLPGGEEISDRTFAENTPRLGGYVIAVPSSKDWYAAQTVDPSQSVTLRSQTSNEAGRSYNGLNDAVSALAVTPNGRALIAGGANGNLCLWTSPNVQNNQASSTAVSALAIAPDGTLALSAHADASLRVYHLPDLSISAIFQSPLGKPFSVSIRPQQDLFAVGSEKPEIGLWPVVSAAAPPQCGAEKPKLLTGHVAAVRATVITPDGSLLISGGDDKTLRMWSLPYGKFLQNLVDLAINYTSVEGTGYQTTDIYGRTVTFTLPCGSPIPPGAVCTCNCVPGAMTIPQHHTQKYNGLGQCTCDLICTCNTVCTCQSVGRGSYGGHYTSYWYPN